MADGQNDKPKSRSTEQKAEDRKKAHAEAREAQAERDLEFATNTGPSEITAVDPMGVERIVAVVYDYDAPEVEPDEAEVKRLANVQKRLDNKREERIKQLTDTPDGARRVAADAFKAESSGSGKVSSKSDVKTGGNS